MLREKVDLIDFWRDEVLPRLIAHGPGEVYREVDFQFRGPRWWRGACPLHGGSRSSSFSVNTETLNWSCHAGCGGGDFLAYLNGGESPRQKAWIDCLKQAAEVAGVDWPEDDRDPDKPRLPRPAPKPRPAPEPPKYPDAIEVAELWKESRPVDVDHEAMAWIKARLCPSGEVGALFEVTSMLHDRGLARVIRKGADCPPWARFGRPWSKTPYRMISPLFDAQGVMRSFHARAIEPVYGDLPKAVTGKETSVIGLVMADPLARQLLLTGALPDWWPIGRTLQVVIVEGEPDFLSWATRFGDADPCSPAIIGIMSGSWTPELASRIPRGAKVAIRTDPDMAGVKYAKTIASKLDHCVCSFKGEVINAA